MLGIHFHWPIASRKSVAKTPRKKLCCHGAPGRPSRASYCGIVGNEVTTLMRQLALYSLGNKITPPKIGTDFNQIFRKVQGTYNFDDVHREDLWNLIYSTKTARGFVHKAPCNGVQPCCLYFTVCILYYGCKSQYLRKSPVLYARFG